MIAGGKVSERIEKLFTLQSIVDLAVIGYKVFTLGFGFKIFGDQTKPGRLYFGFIHLHVNGKTNPVPPKIIPSSVNVVLNAR